MEWRLNILQVSDACGGQTLNVHPDEIVKDICTDSRKITKGAIFVALRGNKFDGHHYIRQALDGGALCCIVERGREEMEKLPMIMVDDTLAALGMIAKLYRQQFDIPVVGITGSVGKTSTKDMVASVLSTHYRTHKTQGNFNNEIGLPLTLFSMSSSDEIMVVEMGMSDYGEISKLTHIARPETAVITNIGVSHIENLGSQEGILRAKSEIFEGMGEDSVAILNGDDVLLSTLAGTLPFDTIYYGIENKNCDLVATNIKESSDSSRFTVNLDGKNQDMVVNAPGRHHIYNAMVAILVGFRYSVPMDKIVEGVGNFLPSHMRQKIVNLANYTLIEDCYNASPQSVRAGLDVLCKMAEGKNNLARRVAILGDMLELGEFSESQHTKVGKWIAEMGIDVLVTVGAQAEFIAKSTAGLNTDCLVYTFGNNEEVKNEINNIIEKDDFILIKGSRGMRMEEIAERITSI